MRLFPLATILLLLPGLAAAQPAPEEPRYEMTTYVFGLIKKGPKWTPEVTEETKKIQAGHMANIRAMAATGKLVVAGPFEDGGDLRGIFIFHNATLEEARSMVNQDPAVRAGRLAVDLVKWWAAAGLRVNGPLPKKE